jgi:predicted RNA-binding Zn-ribbon protein involved in translation (DUF1610 family)
MNDDTNDAAVVVTCPACGAEIWVLAVAHEVLCQCGEMFETDWEEGVT